MGCPPKRLRQAKTVAVGCDQLPESFHGKENSGLFSSSGDQQKQPFVQVNADHNIWIK
jgi:hypothetical protein